VGFADLLELRALVDAEPDHQADQHEHGAEQERDPPAPRQELVGVELAGQEERDRGECDTGGGTGLREGAEEAAATGWGVFDGHQGGAAPFAADGEALHEPEDREQDRCGEPDHGVAGHQAHERGGHTHGDQGDDEHLLAADAVAEVAEHDATDGSGQEPHTEGGERQQRTDERAGVREEQLREDEGGGGAVDEEVVVLDGRADEAGRGHLQRAGPRGGCCR
jgi:hypothetical protein